MVGGGGIQSRFNGGPPARAASRPRASASAQTSRSTMCTSGLSTMRVPQREEVAAAYRARSVGPTPRAHTLCEGFDGPRCVEERRGERGGRRGHQGTGLK